MLYFADSVIAYNETYFTFVHDDPVVQFIRAAGGTE